jgi:hypothetical protein
VIFRILDLLSGSYWIHDETTSQLHAYAFRKDDLADEFFETIVAFTTIVQICCFSATFIFHDIDA